MHNNIKLLSVLSVLRMADAADGGTDDPLDAEVNTIDTSYPVLRAKLLKLHVKESKKEPFKAKQMGGEVDAERIVLKLATVGIEKDTRGRDVNPGHVITHRVTVTPLTNPDVGKNPYTSSDIAKNIAAVAQACGLFGSAKSFIENPVLFQGREIMANVGINKATPEFSESNKITSFENPR